MTTFSRYVGGPAVSERLPVIATALTYAARATPSTDHDTITVPYGVVNQVRIFMPPGTNYSVQLQVGFNGKPMIPSTDPDTYIVGSGFLHVYPWGIPVQGAVDVWGLCDNAYPHTVYIALDMDLNPIIRAAELRTGVVRL